MCEAGSHDAVYVRDVPTPPASFLPTPARKSRRKLWDLSHSLHCPVIGTCLEVDELRRLAKKARARTEGGLSDYDVHVSFVASAETRNPLSVATHKALERKYAAPIRRFAKARSPEQLAPLWQEACANGEVPGALWALVTHPACDADLRTRAYEEVHMLSHQIGAGQRADLKALAAARAELGTLRRDFDALFSRSRQQLEERDQRVADLEARLREAAAEQHRLAARGRELAAALAQRQAAAEADEAAALRQELARRDRRLASLTAERDHWRQACAAAEERAAGLEAEGRELAAEAEVLERLVAAGAACDGCGGEGCTPDLGGRRILCVGGRVQLVDQYRDLVARCNGQFEHHDGGLEDKRQRLEAMLSAADAVVCATDCVSHDAYHRLKRFCKRHAKPHVFLRSSGVSTFARALEDMAG